MSRVWVYGPSDGVDFGNTLTANIRTPNGKRTHHNHAIFFTISLIFEKGGTV